uniref:transmembrane channel-like protein 7 isoform X1 n=2 Tax=Myxine glutinosa TaxID=7769 RepID=UPI00358EB5CB
MDYTHRREGGECDTSSVGEEQRVESSGGHTSIYRCLSREHLPLRRPVTRTRRVHDPFVEMTAAMEDHASSIGHLHQPSGGCPDDADGFLWGRESQDQIPIRFMALPMVEKRQLRRSESHPAGTWDLWKPQRNYLRNLGINVKNTLVYTQLWRGSLTVIAGRFGSGIQSYFSFLRFLVVLNLLVFMLCFCFISVPTIIWQYLGNSTQMQAPPNMTGCLAYDPLQKGLVQFYEYILDVLSGTGILEYTYLFYGYYNLGVEQVVEEKASYQLPLAYLLCMLFCQLLCLIFVFRNSVEGFKQRLIQAEDSELHYSRKAFCGWDFNLGDKKAANLKQSGMYYEFVTDLEEDRSKLQAAERTTRQRFCIVFIRLMVNIIVLALLCAAVALVYYATTYSQEYISGSTILPDVKKLGLEFLQDFIIQYLPSIAIGGLNFLLPLFFNSIMAVERYTPSTTISVMLIRSVILRFASLSILVYALWSGITCYKDKEDCSPCGYNYKAYPCWETRVGQEMYKLAVFDFFTTLMVTLLYQFPRKLIVKFCKCRVTNWWGEMEFDVPDNVLATVYGQTVCWVGLYYCPLLPLLNLLKYGMLFHIKKLALLKTCRPASRPFRASSSKFFFYVVLLLGFILSCIPIGYTITSMTPSRACGPFKNDHRPWDQIVAMVEAFPQWLTAIVRFLTSQLFAILIFIVSCLLIAYVLIVSSTYRHTCHLLKDQLTALGKDRAFLLERINAANSGVATKSSFAQKKSFVRRRH